GGGFLCGDLARGNRISGRQAEGGGGGADARGAGRGAGGARAGRRDHPQAGARARRLRPPSLRARERRGPGARGDARPRRPGHQRAGGEGVIVVLALLLAQPAGAQLFSDANAAYLSGDVARAIASYEALIAQGVVSPELETNLGAAYLRQGKRGLAALHLERALFLDPGDDDARADLIEVRRGNVDKLEGESEEGGTDTLARVLAPLPGGTAAVLMLALWCAGWTL